jgi:hypothetical protein
VADLKIGKGVYVWQPGTIEDGNPERIAARLRLAGVQTAAVKICDGFQLLSGCEALIQTLRNQNIRVGAWGYSYLNRAPIQEAHVVANACHHYNPDFYLINVEAEVEKNYDGARMFMNQLRPATSGLPLGLNTYWNVRAHQDFPWAAFLEKVDFVCPLVYWRGVDPVGKLMETQQGYGSVGPAPDVPMPVVGGDLYVDNGVKPTPEQVTAFLMAADSDPFIHGVLMWAADDTQTTPELWQAFSLYQWRDAGRVIPPQPIGWAKVKAPKGMRIRSTPQGSTVGGLGKAELAPLWTVTDTKWGAITRAADQWIYVGDPTLVDVALETSSGPGQVPPVPQPPIPYLYQARVVPSRGLHVRDAVGGRALRALLVGTIVHVYAEQHGWARIDPLRSEWVNAAYLQKIGS